MSKRLGHLFQFICWGALTGAASILTVGINALPAAADELNNWGYDSQTRSLIINLPPDISPSVSVLASDQLLIALPNTQIGDPAGLTVGDGVVDNIMLEQTTPETLWVIMKFAEGTVLANTQSVVPVGEGANAASQQWEVRPAIVASSGSAPNVASEPAINGGGAESLRASAVDVAQADFPDLPILEPGIVLSKPVSVPPLDTPTPTVVPSLPPVVAEVSRPVVSLPDLSAAAETEVAVEEPVPAEVVSIPVEVIAPVEAIAPAEEIASDREEAAASDEIATSKDIPDEPPFLGASTFEAPIIDETALSADRPDEFVEAPAAADEPVAVATPEESMPTAADEIPAEAVATAERESPAESAVEPAAEPAVEPLVEPAAEPTLTAAKVEPEQIDLFAQGVTPQNTTNRWPDPIPFGVPLPR